MLLVKSGIFDEAPLACLEQRLEETSPALAAVRSVGRLVDRPRQHGLVRYRRIDDDLIVTNRHVASLFAGRPGRLFRRLNQAGKRVRTRVNAEEYRQPGILTSTM